MRQQQVTHKGGPVDCKYFQGLAVRKMPLTTTDAILQKRRILSIFKHIIIVIGFLKCCMALTEVTDQPVAGSPNISKYTNRNSIVTNDEAMRINGIMVLWKCCN